MTDAYQTSGNSPTVFEPLLDDGQAGEMLGLASKDDTEACTARGNPSRTHWALLALSCQCVKPLG